MIMNVQGEIDRYAAGIVRAQRWVVAKEVAAGVYGAKTSDPAYPEICRKGRAEIRRMEAVLAGLRMKADPSAEPVMPASVPARPRQHVGILARCGWAVDDIAEALCVPATAIEPLVGYVRSRMPAFPNTVPADARPGRQVSLIRKGGQIAVVTGSGTTLGTVTVDVAVLLTKEMDNGAAVTAWVRESPPRATRYSIFTRSVRTHGHVEFGGTWLDGQVKLPERKPDAVAAPEPQVLLKLQPPAGVAHAFPDAPGHTLPAAAVVAPSAAVPERVDERKIPAAPHQKRKRSEAPAPITDTDRAIALVVRAMQASYRPTTALPFKRIAAAQLVEGQHGPGVEAEVELFDGLTAHFECSKFGPEPDAWTTRWSRMEGGDIELHDGKWRRVPDSVVIPDHVEPDAGTPEAIREALQKKISTASRRTRTGFQVPTPDGRTRLGWRIDKILASVPDLAEVDRRDGIVDWGSTCEILRRIDKPHGCLVHFVDAFDGRTVTLADMSAQGPFVELPLLGRA